MKKPALWIIVCMCSACTQQAAPGANVAASANALSESAASQAASPAAPPPTTCAQTSDGCEATRDELAAVRRQLGFDQRELEQAPGGLSVNIGFTVSGQPLQLDTPYALASGKVTFRGVRYWLSQLRLTRQDGNTIDIAESYYLMEVREQQTLRGGTQQPVILPSRRRESIVLTQVPPGDYRAVSFNVGVDAAHNDDLSTAVGELNVLQNMASIQWMWFTSYIFTQLDAVIAGEGAAEEDDAGAPIDLQLLWENGTDQDLRRIELALPAVAHVGHDTHPNITLELDAAALFTGLDPQLAAARTASPSAPSSSISATDDAPRARLADNWSHAFRAVSVSQGAP